VKKLRRQGIAAIGAANDFLETEYWADHNQRFARPPVSAEDFHVAVPRGVRLEAVFRLEEHRTVSNDWVVRYDNRYFQLERHGHRPPARAIVQVYEAPDGAIEIRYRERAMRWEELTAETLRARRTPAQPAWPPAPPRSTRSSAGPGRRPPAVDHPWRGSYKGRTPHAEFWAD
jgi:hypothetical protein